MLVGPIRGQGKESAVVDEVAVSESEFAEGPSLGKQGCHRVVSDHAALMQVNLEDVGAMFGKGENRLVRQLSAVVQFKLH